MRLKVSNIFAVQNFRADSSTKPNYLEDTLHNKRNTVHICDSINCCTGQRIGIQRIMVLVGWKLLRSIKGWIQFDRLDIWKLGVYLWESDIKSSDCKIRLGWKDAAFRRKRKPIDLTVKEILKSQEISG